MRCGWQTQHTRVPDQMPPLLVPVSTAIPRYNAFSANPRRACSLALLLTVLCWPGVPNSHFWAMPDHFLAIPKKSHFTCSRAASPFGQFAEHGCVRSTSRSTCLQISGWCCCGHAAAGRANTAAFRVKCLLSSPCQQPFRVNALFSIPTTRLFAGCAPGSTLLARCSP